VNPAIERVTQPSEEVVALLGELNRALDAAMRFYERAGYERCGAFGPYAEMPLNAIATSVFYEKTL
jgi:hypothetical protein